MDIEKRAEMSQFTSSLLCCMQQTLLWQYNSWGHVSSITVWCLSIDNWLDVRVFFPILVVSRMKSTVRAFSAIDVGYILFQGQKTSKSVILLACDQGLEEMFVGGTCWITGL